LGAGILVGVFMSVAHVNAIKALYWSAVINGIVAVPLIFVLIRLASNSELMGKWRSSRIAIVWAWLCFILMAAAAVSMFVI
jgi:Mn2+/Fe2+ NRAMP family transporter